MYIQFARTPLHYAAGSGYDAICDILIQAGAGVNAVDKVCELLILGPHLGDDPPPHLSQKKIVKYLCFV